MKKYIYSLAAHIYLKLYPLLYGKPVKLDEKWQHQIDDLHSIAIEQPVLNSPTVNKNTVRNIVH